jgi:hypothetical protein
MKTIKILLVAILLGLISCQKETIKPDSIPQIGYVKITNINPYSILSDCGVYINLIPPVSHIDIFILDTDSSRICKYYEGELKITGLWFQFLGDEGDYNNAIKYEDEKYITIIKDDTVDCYLTPTKNN